MTIPFPSRNDPAIEMTPSGQWVRSEKQQQEAYDRAIRQRWRALTLYIKATLEAAEAGIITLEDAFLAYTALPGGMTTSAWIQAHIDTAYRTGQIPPLLPLLAPPGEAR